MRHVHLLAALLLLSSTLAGCMDGEGLGFNSTTDGPPAAAIAASALEGDVGDAFTFRAEDPRDGATYTWDMGGFDTLTGAEVTYQFPYDNHTYAVTLRAQDAEGRNATATESVRIGSGENTAPTTTLWGATDWTRAGTAVAFDARNTSDPDGDPVNVQWFLARAAGGGGGGGDGHDHDHRRGASATTDHADGADAFTMRLLGPGHDGGHGDGDTQWGPDEPLDAQGLTTEVTFDEPGTYRVTVEATDAKGAVARASHVLDVSTFVPKSEYNVTHTGTLAVGTLGVGVSTTMYQAFYPPENRYIDGALYEFILRYPGTTTITLTWENDPGDTGRVHDLDFELVHVDAGEMVASGKAQSATTGEPMEQDTVALPGGSYRLTVQAHTGADIAYALNVYAELQVDPDAKPYSGAANE